MMTDAVGFLAGLLILISMVPQILKSWRTRQTRDLSFAMFALYVIGVIFWLAYGILLGSSPIIVMNGITLILASANLYLKIKYG